MAEGDINNEKTRPEEAARAPAEPESGVVASKKEFIQAFFKRAEEFTETLLRENERLRYRELELEAQLRAATSQAGRPVAEESGALRELVSRIESLEKEREQMLARFRSVQRENFDFEERSREIERENNNLANLYVASYQLHSTLDLREITQIILEILLNFVGARTFALLLLDEQAGTLRTLAAEGIARDKIPSFQVGKGAIGAVVQSGRALLDGSGAQAHRGPLDLERPLIVSPLRIKDKVVGAIVVWEFLQQKTEMADVDYELLNLLAAHAASALQSAKLNADLGGRPPALWRAVDLV